MGQKLSFYKMNFEDMQLAIKRGYIIISTLDVNNQKCLIKSTIDPEKEIALLNELIRKNKETHIIVYGENSSDMNPFTKYKQLNDLGFTNVNVYGGGLFEWLLLQDIYGTDEFPTTSSELDLLKYKGQGIFNMQLLTDF